MGLHETLTSDLPVSVRVPAKQKQIPALRYGMANQTVKQM